MTRTLLRMLEVCMFDSEVWLFSLLRVGRGVWHSDYTLVSFVLELAELLERWNQISKVLVCWSFLCSLCCGRMEVYCYHVVM